MNEALFYHAIALSAHGDHHLVKKYRAGAESWEGAYAALKETGMALADPFKAYERLARLGIRLIMSSQKEYPERLRHISQSPFGIYVRGELSANDLPLALAVVGTRRASADGKATARTFARELAGAGFTIVSGLAFGIDAAAHEGCLSAGGVTIAVLAGGLDGVYPHAHDALARRILQHGGALVSEYPPGEEPFPYRFIERNRIISGIARGVLIVEAPESSGALATARYAVEQNREVFVTPGGMTSANFKGSHALIRQGAEFVSSPDDIMEAYDVEKNNAKASSAGAASAEEILILKALAEILFPATVDKLAEMTKLEPRIINRALSFLIIRGIVKESGRGYTI
jgi:DNA processing protein